MGCWAASRTATINTSWIEPAVFHIWPSSPGKPGLRRIRLKEDGAYLATMLIAALQTVAPPECPEEITVRLLTDDDGSHRCGGPARDRLAAQRRPSNTFTLFKRTLPERPFRARDIAWGSTPGAASSTTTARRSGNGRHAARVPAGAV